MTEEGTEPKPETSRKAFVVTDKGNAVSLSVLENLYSATKTESKGLPEDSFGAAYGEAGLRIPLNDPQVLVMLLEMNTWHATCCRTKAWDVGGLGWTLKPVIPLPEDQTDPAYQAMLDQKKPAEEFFKKCDPQWAYNAMINFESIGYAGIEIVREDPAKGNSLPENLVVIPAHTLRAHIERHKYQQRRDARTVWFRAAGYQKDVNLLSGQEGERGSMGEQAASDLIWILNYTPRSDYYGTPDVMPAIGAVYGDMSLRDYNIAFFKNFGVPSYLVTLTGNFDGGAVNPTTGKNALETAIEQKFADIQGHPHAIMFISAPSGTGTGDIKLEWQPLAVEVKEASFRLYRQDNRTEIIAAHRVPPYRLGIAVVGDLGGSTATEATEIYKTSVIEPRQKLLEDAINRYILWPTPEEGGFGCTGWRFEFADIDNTDEMHDADLALKLFGMGAITPNQIIAQWKDRFGLELIDHPAMDAHYIGGMAVDLDYEAEPVPEEVIRTLKTLQDGLTAIVNKGASS